MSKRDELMRDVETATKFADVFYNGNIVALDLHKCVAACDRVNAFARAVLNPPPEVREAMRRIDRCWGSDELPQAIYGIPATGITNPERLNNQIEIAATRDLKAIASWVLKVAMDGGSDA